MQHPCSLSSRENQILNLKLCQPSNLSPHPVESSDSLPHHTLYFLFISHCPTALLCQSYRGSEWAWSSTNASEINSGRLSTPFTAVRVLSSTPPSSTPSFAHGSKPSSLPQFFSSFVLITPTWPPLPRHYQSFALFKAHPLPSPSTVDLIPQLSWTLSCRRFSLSPKSQSSA